MKNNFVKGIKNFFSSSTSNPPKQTKNNKKQQIVPRVVNFGNGTEDKIKSENNQDKTKIQEIIEEVKDNRYQTLQKYPSFKEIGLNKGQVVDGQTITLYQPKCITCKMVTGKYEEIRLIVTDYKLYIVDLKLQVRSFPLAKIQKLHKYINNQNYMKILIVLKDGRKFKFRVNIQFVWKKVFDQIQKFAFVKYKKQFFAFQFYKVNKQLEDKYKGWSLYSPQKEFARMGLKLHKGENTNIESDFKILDNRNGRVCDTYPEILIVPSKIPQDSLIRCSKFRSRNRMPALSYAFEYRPGCFSSLYRSSQSKTGVKNNRSKDDEIMLGIIGNPKISPKELQANPNQQKINCVIYDARNYMAALGNKISGKGYESQEYYINCKVEFLNIPNIHAVRDSYLKVIKAVFGDDSKFFSTLADSEWYDFVFLILNGALEIANNLRKGVNILVHCSDGWDRTAQLCALAAIMLDPFYRTMQGFAILIQKDWVHFGHQFSVRLGQGMNEPGSQQRSQIFLQYLDCVSQLLFQFPSQFQFNYKFLKQIGDQAYSSIFGNFLCNCELQMKRYKVQEQTVSLWSYILSDKQQYLNPYYVSSGCFLQVSTSQKSMRFFKQLFLSNIQAFKDIYDIYSCKFTEDNLEIMYKQLKKEKELLQQKVGQNEDILKQIQLQIQRKQSQDYELNQQYLKQYEGEGKAVRQSNL